MIVNLKDVSAENPNEFIKSAGTTTLKITSWEDDGYDKLGNAKIKISFKNSQNQNYTENFSIEGDYSWRFKRFSNAMRTPDSYETDELIGRYIVAIFVMTKAKNGSGLEYANVSEWDYSPSNDKIKPFSAVSDAVVSDEEDPF
jgi:hypothetical protein